MRRPCGRVLRVRDPIHNYIHLDELGADLVDAPRVQRLRRLHQLGTGNLVYPGANHTRFEHSLGAWHLAERAARSLGLTDGERQAVKAAALLHDVGHGPFSHTCDALYRDYLGKSHEDVTIEWLQRGNLPEVLARHGVDAREVARLVRGEGPLGSLVSGDVDVDRLDYLVRDSHYTGVSIGVDLARLVEDVVLTPEGVALREGSITAAEMLLVTRVQMYAAVYLHRTCRVGERMIERAFRLALDAGEIRPEQLTQRDDAAATMLLRHSKTDAWRLFLAVDQRKLMKVALEEPLRDFREDALVELAASTKRQHALEQEIAAALGVPPLDVIVDAPELPAMPEHGARIILDDGRVVPLDEVSSLVRGLGEAQRDHWRLRVIVPPSKRAEAPAKAGPILHKHLS